MKRFRFTSSYCHFNYSLKPQSRKLSIRSHSTASKPTITAYGKRINASDLFSYTYGRWLFNEKQELAERYVKFDVDELCRRAASIFGDSTRCTKIDKIEGGSNKALALTMNDGNEVIAKLPCPNAGPAHYTTASEVATLDFVRSHTSIPVPRVLGWDSDPANPVGAEYIFLEKIGGAPLTIKWNAMKPVEKFKLLERIVDVEAELTKIQFPAYGSLYYQDSISDSSLRHPLSTTVDGSNLYCVGPPCSVPWSHVAISNATSKSRGPWPSLEDYTMAAIRRMRAPPENKQQPEAYRGLVESLTKLMQSIVHHPEVIVSSKPVLWHNDMHHGNIFVSPDDPTSLRGIIDWQSTVIAPLFLQSRFPVFLKSPTQYIAGPVSPELPSNFEQMEEEDKEQALSDKRLAEEHKAYEMYILKKNKEAHIALGLNRNLWDPFQRCHRYSPNTVPSLRDRLLNVSKNWDTLGMPTDCPFTVEYDLEKHQEEMETESDVKSLQEMVQNYTGAGDDGWIFADEWEAVNAANKELLEKFIQMADEAGESKEEAVRMWPFLDRE